MIDPKITNNLKHIKEIPVLFGIDENQLTNILKTARIINLSKGKTLFSEGEKADRFYIVLNGLIKLLRINNEGNEAIIGIADSGSLCGIFNNRFPFNCVATKDSTIISFSLTEFRNLVKENNSLMHNILLDISLQNETLLEQLSNLKSDNAKKKVGQFLLKNSIKKGKKLKSTDLECSKNEIASYLGIRPETFSRILYQLKDEGEILVKKNQILLTEEKSLCSYCSEEISFKCKTHGTHFCKY